VRVSEQEIQELKNFVFLLNSKVDSAVIVEGKKRFCCIKEDWVFG